MLPLAISLLGYFQVTLGDEPVTGFGYDKVRALLAYLAVESGRPHRRESLCALFWPDQNAKTARHSLSQALLKLRQALKDQQTNFPRLIADRETVQLNLRADDDLDISVFDANLEACDTHAHIKAEQCEYCIERMEAAVAIYQGEFLHGLLVSSSTAFEDWVIIQRERRHTRALNALHILTNHYLHRGRCSQAQKHALLQVALEPYREEAHRALMRSLACSGQRSAALAQYERCRSILAEELGVEPSSQTQTLYKQIRSAGEIRPHNLPTKQMPLVGREPELDEIGSHLANPDCHLLTLVGIGGIGKTSLALEAAREHLGDFLHGTFWIPLAPLHHPEEILATLITALSLTQGSDPETQLIDFLRAKSALLIFDNFEHLIPTERGGNNTALNLLNNILQNAPHVKCMVTSRERLSLRAEWIIQLDGLTYPQDRAAVDVNTLPDYAAIRLFVQRARQVMPNFPAQRDEYQDIARICQLLQGIPLGIELASGWSDHHSCQMIADEIESDLDFLVTSLRDTPDRHQSLRAVFNHSWKLLSDEEQAVLRKLAVFETAFSRAAAQQVSGAVRHQLTALANKSFLHLEVDGHYSMHRLLKQFLDQALAANPIEEQATRNAHAAHYAQFLKAREYALTVQFKGAALDEVGAVIPDIRAAWDWATSQKDTVFIDDALESLYTYYWARNQFSTGRTILENAAEIVETLKQTEENQLLLGRLWCRCADFIYWQDDLKVAEKLLLKSIELLRALASTDELAYTLELLSRVYFWQGEYGQAKEAGTEAIEHARTSGVQHHLAQALSTMATIICEESGDFETANSLYNESLELYQELENPFGIAKTLINQGATFYELGDYPTAQKLYYESLKRYREINYTYGISACLNNLALITRKLGDFKQSKALIEESLTMKREIGNHVTILHALLEIGALSIEMENYTGAREYFSEALQMALEAQTIGLTYNIVLGFAELYAKTGNEQQAAELAAWVLTQENVGQEAKTQAETIIAGVEQLLTADELAISKDNALGQDIQSIALCLTQTV